MPGLLDFLSGGQSQPAGIMGVGQLDSDSLSRMMRQRQQDAFFTALLKAGQPSTTPTGLGAALGMGLAASNEASNPIKDEILKAQIKNSMPEWGETKDAMGNPIVYDKRDPTKFKQIGTSPFGVLPVAGGMPAMSSQDFAAALPDSDPTKQFISNNPLPATSQPQQSAGGQSGLTGEEYLKTLPPAIAAQVKGIADGKIAFPSGFQLKQPYWQQMLTAVSQYDPNFDAVNYNARNKTYQDFTSGKSSQNLTAMNTAIGHLKSLSDDYGKLDNSSIPAWNWLENKVRVNVGDPTVQTNVMNVATDANAVASEMAKVFRSTGMSEKDIDEWREKISTSATPAESKAVVNKAIELLASRMDAMGQQYNQGMGTSKDGVELLSPKTRAIYEELTGKAPSRPVATGKDTPPTKPGVPLDSKSVANAILMAKNAIAKGANPQAVAQRLKENGIDPRQAGF